MASKYQPLADYFQSLPHETDDVTIAFAKIEDILKFALPEAAHQFRAWWNWEVNPKHPQKIVWQKAGWKVKDTDLSRKTIRFERINIAPHMIIPSRDGAPPIPELSQAIKLPIIEIQSSLSLIISRPAWKPIIMIPRGSILQKGRHGLYHNITAEAALVKEHFGCYSWGNASEIFYIGSFSRDRKNNRFQSNFQARIHNYLQNHRLNENGRKNTNLMVFENLNDALKTQDIFLRIFTCEWIRFGDKEWDITRISDDGDLVLSCERLLISWYKALGQCQWNRR
jgi:hypothetical protein